MDDVEEFRKFGKAAVDYLANYFETIRERPVLPSVEPGYLQNLIPKEAPEHPEKWEEVMKDMEKVIMPGVRRCNVNVVEEQQVGVNTVSRLRLIMAMGFQVTHWQSPRFHAYFPSACSFPAMVGELISAGLGVIGFSWMSSPACTELEVIMMDWLGKLMHIPKPFLNCSGGPGGGIIQGSASESTFVCLLAAKHRMLGIVKKEHPEWDESYIKGKMRAYTSDQSNSSVEKAGILGSMPMRLLPTDNKGCLRGDTLLKAFQDDINNGLIPTYVCATLGTTPTCAYDNLDEIGPLCNSRNIWLHVDAAYAAAAFVCPEYKHLLSGVQYADSFNFNPHKWLLVNFDCSALWLKNANHLTDAFKVERIYLKHKKQGVASAPDYRDWQIPLGRRFRALKLWMTLRMYGASGLQNHIRKQVGLAKDFENLVKSDRRFELAMETALGLVCFRLKGPNELTKQLHELLTYRGNIYTIAAIFQDVFFIRFVVCSRLTTIEDILYSWNEIRDQATIVLEMQNNDNYEIDK